MFKIPFELSLLLNNAIGRINHTINLLFLNLREDNRGPCCLPVFVFVFCFSSCPGNEPLAVLVHWVAFLSLSQPHPAVASALRLHFVGQSFVDLIFGPTPLPRKQGERRKEIKECSG